MKIFLISAAFVTANLIACKSSTQSVASNTPGNDKPVTTTTQASPKLFLDMHHMGPGKVTADAVAQAHLKDLATEGKYGVSFLKYWVDEANGNVYCLATSPDSVSIRNSHAEAHGLLPDRIFEVTGGPEASLLKGKNFFLDVHEFGPGNVSAKDVAGAHQKDLATEKKYGVNFINYWVNEKEGRVVCLSQAADSTDVIKTHKEAHGLLPAYIVKVKQGQ